MFKAKKMLNIGGKDYLLLNEVLKKLELNAEQFKTRILDQGEVEYKIMDSHTYVLINSLKRIYGKEKVENLIPKKRGRKVIDDAPTPEHD